MFPSENDSQLGDVLVAAEPVGPLRGMSARRTLRGRRARATRPRCSTRVKGVFVVREDRRVDDPPWGAHVDDGSIFRYSGFDDTVAVWAGADAVAQDWWDDSALRRPHGEWVTEAHSLVSDLSQMGQPAIVDIIQALVDQGASDNELDFVGAGPLEDLLSHDGHALAFADEVEKRARQQPRFRLALAGVWLSSDVPSEVRDRLGRLGAKILES